MAAGRESLLPVSHEWRLAGRACSLSVMNGGWQGELAPCQPRMAAGRKRFLPVSLGFWLAVKARNVPELLGLSSISCSGVRPPSFIDASPYRARLSTRGTNVSPPCKGGEPPGAKRGGRGSI